jgi:hypothetical protein
MFPLSGGLFYFCINLSLRGNFAYSRDRIFTYLLYTVHRSRVAQSV